jgi:hypothetical protein
VFFAPYQKGSAGLVERFNQTVELTLRKIFEGEDVRAADWPDWLRAAEFAINTTQMHKNFSALQLVTEVQPRTAEQSILPFSLDITDEARRKLEVGTVQTKLRREMQDIWGRKEMERAEAAHPARDRSMIEGDTIYVNMHRHAKGGLYGGQDTG